MSQLGFSVMLNMLMGGDRGASKLQASLNKKIAKLELQSGDPDRLYFEFEDGENMSLRDDGQSCCEHRYMTTDDDLPHYVGAELLGIEVADGPDAEDEYGECHEQQFLRINTSKGVLVVVTHNEHNGYYGGFSLVVE